MKIEIVKLVRLQDFNNLVVETYNKPYHFQQQDGCKDRGIHKLTIPGEDEDYENDFIPEEVNGDEMGVSFKAWLARDPKTPIGNDNKMNQWEIDLFWHRNFYPDVQTLANDLHAKGLIEAGTYVINIDW